jgi:hypothetical protein
LPIAHGLPALRRLDPAGRAHAPRRRRAGTCGPDPQLARSGHARYRATRRPCHVRLSLTPVIVAIAVQALREALGKLGDVLG